MFFEQISTEGLFFFILYGITGVVPLIAAVYLLLRRGNAIAPGITPPVRLRRWTASFFIVLSLAHVWWLLFYIYSHDLNAVGNLVLAMIDSVLLFATFSGMLLAMLQDRRRHMWPVLVAVIPFVLLGGADMGYPSSLLENIAAAYLLLLDFLFTGYMVFAIRQYGRWLNDNYADLENKKVWLCQTVALVCMLLFILYVLATDMVFIWLVHIVELVLVALLLWRVETLPHLENTSVKEVCTTPVQEMSQVSDATTQEKQALNIPSKIEQLLKERCVDTQLYLQHDLTLHQLAQTIGTNRFYLSQYFSRQGITYNAYINDLRINHFIRLYREATATGQSFVVLHLANSSGYRSYSTFSLAFKQRMGQSVKAWMHNMEK